MTSELASAGKLRNFYMKGCKCNDPYTVIKCGVPRKVREIADEIEREVSERFIELPVDADGVPIHLGDRLDNFGEKFVCEWIEYETGNASVGYAIGDGELPPAYAPDECTHVKTRTIEDVLSKFGVEYNYRYPNTGDLIEEIAAELRGMMEVDND